MTEEEKLFKRLDLKGKTVFDIGAFNGIFTLFFARAVGEKGKVVAFEPNPSLCKTIKENLLLNNFSNVEVMQVALGRYRKKEILAFPLMQPGIGSIEEHEKTRILRQKGVKAS